jgi:hypothetical protein
VPAGVGPGADISTIAVTNVSEGGNTKVEATTLDMDKLRRSDVIQFGKVLHKKSVIVALGLEKRRVLQSNVAACAVEELPGVG